MDQDVLEASVGIRRFMPSGCFAALAADDATATELVTAFRERFNIELESDFLNKRLDQLLGVRTLSFREDDYARVKSYPAAIQLANLEEARNALPQIRFEHKEKGGTGDSSGRST